MQPVSGKDRPYKPMVKSGGAQRESDGVVVPEAAQKGAVRRKGPDFGHAVGGGKRKGMAGTTRPKSPRGHEHTDNLHRWPSARIMKKVRQRVKELTGRNRNGVKDMRVLISDLNPILRGWVNYFAVGHSSRCFSFVRDWVEKKMRRHLMRTRQRRGFGWRRWSRRWFYEGLGLFDGYRVRRHEPRLKASPT